MQVAKPAVLKPGITIEALPEPRPSDLAGTTSTQVVHGRALIFWDPKNPSKIAEAIDWIFSHPAEAEAMGRRGRDYAVRNFSWSAEADKLYGLYERLLEPRLNG